MTTYNWLSFSLAIILGLVSLHRRNAKGLPVIAALLISCIGDAFLANRNQHFGHLSPTLLPFLQPISCSFYTPGNSAKHTAAKRLWPQVWLTAFIFP